MESKQQSSQSHHQLPQPGRGCPELTGSLLLLEDLYIKAWPLKCLALCLRPFSPSITKLVETSISLSSESLSGERVDHSY